MTIDIGRWDEEHNNTRIKNFFTWLAFILIVGVALLLIFVCGFVLGRGVG